MLLYDHEVNKAAMADVYLDILDLEILNPEIQANCLLVLYQLSSYSKFIEGIDLFDEADYNDLCDDLLQNCGNLSKSISKNFNKEDLENNTCSMVPLSEGEEFDEKKHYFTNIKSLTQDWISRSKIMGVFKVIE